METVLTFADIVVDYCPHSLGTLIEWKPAPFLILDEVGVQYQVPTRWGH
ncbi:MAG: hypothetical protein RLZZ184_2098 [Cyanobacteriota bacterium]